MRYRLGSPLLAAALLVISLACGKANPVAPAGSTVTLSANPSVISSPTGSSTITAVVRKGNGQPAAGVEVRFTASLGTIDVLQKTDNSGIATATLRGDGRFGTSMVGAVVDGGATATQISVAIGITAKSIALSVNPPSIPTTGGHVDLVALLRDSNGQPLAGTLVNFTAALGRLSNGGIDTTNGSGEASVSLTVAASDLVNNPPTITVTAQAAAGDGSVLSASSTLTVLTAKPIAAFTVQNVGGPTSNEVFFVNQSSGQGTLTYDWNFGDGTPDSNAFEPTHTYAAAGNYTVSLTVTPNGNSSLAAVATQQITVPVKP